MAVQTLEVSPNFWATMDVAPNGDWRDLRALRCLNADPVNTLRAKFYFTTAAKVYQEFSELVGPKEDKTVDVAARNGGRPFQLAGVDAGFGTEQA